MKKDNRYFIFCDFDGVLASWRDWYGRRYGDTNDISLKSINNKTILALDRVISSICCYKNRRGNNRIEVYFIPTSSWARKFSIVNGVSLKRWLKSRGCKWLKEYEYGRNIINEYSEYNRSLCDENNVPAHERRCYLISKFIKDYNVKSTNYICFDDEGKDSYSKYKLHLIKTDMYDGITYKNIMKFVNVVKRWSRRHES